MERARGNLGVSLDARNQKSALLMTGHSSPPKMKMKERERVGQAHGGRLAPQTALHVHSMHALHASGSSACMSVHHHPAKLTQRRRRQNVEEKISARLAGSVPRASGNFDGV
jgi:hypothetical protein